MAVPAVVFARLHHHHQFSVVGRQFLEDAFPAPAPAKKRTERLAFVRTRWAHALPLEGLACAVLKLTYPGR